MSEVVYFDPSLEDDGNLSALAGWEKHLDPGPEIEIVSGVLKNGTPNSEATAQNTTAHNADHYAEIKLSGTKDNNRVGCIVAGQTPGADQDFYMSHMTFSSENVVDLRTAKKVEGAYDGSLVNNVDFLDDSVFRLVRAGDVAMAFIDGVQRGIYTNSTGGQLLGGQPGILFEDGGTVEASEFRSGNVLSTTNTVSKSAVDFPDQSNETNNPASVPMEDSLGDPEFTSSGTITRYRAAGLPPGITINESTGVMSGTPDNGSEGVYSVHIWAEDDQGWLEGTSFDWTITTGTAPSDTTAPTVDSASVPTAGDTISVQMSESMQVGAGGSGGWTISLSDATIGAAAVDGTDATIINLTPSRTLTSSDSFTIGYTQPTDGFQDQAATPNDLATFSGQAVTNNSTQTAAVAGLPAYVLNRSGVALGNLTGIKLRVTATAALDGTELYYADNLTATGGTLDSAIDLSATVADIGDTVVVTVLTSGNYGVAVETTVEDIS